MTGLFALLCALQTSFTAANYLSTRGNQIVNRFGDNVRIAGVNWFGFETDIYVPYGLSERSYKSLLNQAKDIGFNTLRLPFSGDMLHITATELTMNYELNPELVGLTPLEVLDKVIEYCEEIDMRIFLDRHSCISDHYFVENLW